MIEPSIPARFSTEIPSFTSMSRSCLPWIAANQSKGRGTKPRVDESMNVPPSYGPSQAEGQEPSSGRAGSYFRRLAAATGRWSLPSACLTETPLLPEKGASTKETLSIPKKRIGNRTFSFPTYGQKTRNRRAIRGRRTETEREDIHEGCTGTITCQEFRNYRVPPRAQDPKCGARCTPYILNPAFP